MEEESTNDSRQPAAYCSVLPWRRETLLAQWCAAGNPDAALRGFSSSRTWRVAPDPYVAPPSGARPAAKKRRRPREDQFVRPGYVSKYDDETTSDGGAWSVVSPSLAEYDDDQRPTSLRSLGRNVNRPWNGSAVSPSVPIRQLFDFALIALAKPSQPDSSQEAVCLWSSWLQVLFWKPTRTGIVQFPVLFQHPFLSEFHLERTVRAREIIYRKKEYESRGREVRCFVFSVHRLTHRAESEHCLSRDSHCRVWPIGRGFLRMPDWKTSRYFFLN